MKSKWRFLDTGPRTAAENMALDDVLLECKARNLIPDTIRLLRFKPPAVLVGYHQNVEHEIRLDYVKGKGIDVNRRVTGGGAIYFDETSIGWEIIASKNSIPPYDSIEELFEIMCGGVVKALRNLGVNASFRPKNDIEVNGRKISGTGGTERENAILFQGTLLVDFDVETMIKALRIPIVKLKDKELNSIKERVTCLKWELNRNVTYKEVKNALKASFEEVFEIELEDGNLTFHEKKYLNERLEYFRSDDWIFLDRRVQGEPALVNAITKKPGGIIRVSLALDREVGLIKSILITGDFFVFPPRAIYDLEAKLKFTPCDEKEIRKIVYDFFKENDIQVPGISPEDFVEIILEAVDKLSYEQFGLKSDEVNHIYPITRRAKEVMLGKCEYLLLPYCAKLVTCEYRKKEGCLKCGLCSISEAYILAEKAGLKPLTIQNFEHLMSVLKMMKEQGSEGFIGCCCEAFYQKHRDELEEMGVPGIIIDIDDRTCYDLGKQREAYKGDFETQTRLKMNILSRLLKYLQKKRGEVYKCEHSTL